MVRNISVLWTPKGTVPRLPKLTEKTNGIKATSAVNSLTAEERKLRSAIGARVIFRAQLKAVTFSGNSESTGAIHWMKKNTAPEPSNPIKNESAIVLIDSTNASVTKTNVSAAK